MKQILILFAMMSTAVFAVEKKDLMPLIEEAALKRESAYVAVRDKITGYGTNALPLLMEFGTDELLPWQQQLVARICYERIERGEEIKKLLETDWYSHPKFDPLWNQKRSGPETSMASIVIPDLKEAGLWYYYLEVLWKATGEDGKIRKRSPTSDRWAGGCAVAIKDNPEERIWFIRVCSEILAGTPPEPAPLPPPNSLATRHVA